MHDLEPHYNWRQYYSSEEDPGSPFFEQSYNEFEYTTEIYGYYIHPQWDSVGSKTLYVKVIYADYERATAVIELIGEWNDILYNDIMYLKRELIDILIGQGLSKFILMGENVLNFHPDGIDYYEEWFDEIDEQDGYIALVNFRDHVQADMSEADIDSFFLLGGKINDLDWRSMMPEKLIDTVDDLVQKRLDFIPS